MNKYDILCVGILVADVIAKPVDILPDKGLLGLLDSIGMYSGGNAMTAAVNISKLGVRSAIIGKVGEDSFGSFLTQTLQSNNVNIDGLSVDQKAQTSSSVVLSDSSGERTFLHCIGANGTFSIDDINWSIVENSKIVFVTGSFLMDTFDGEQTSQFLKKCKEMGKITALDVCWDSKGRWSTVLNQCLPYIDIFMPSREEAIQLTGETEPDKIAKTFFENGVKSVVLKIGKDGCYIQESPNAIGEILPTYDNVKVVDTTGAGDSFCAGFLTALSKNMSFKECGKFANAVGTHCVMEKGATTGVKPYEEIIAFMEQNQEKSL